MKVLHVAETVKGGVATYLNLLEVVTPYNENIYLVPGAHFDAVVSKKKIAHSASRSIFGILALALKTLRMAAKYKVDVVFAHSTFAGLACAVISVLFGWKYKFIYCPHGWASFSGNGFYHVWLIRSVERLLSYYPDVVINISNYEHDRVLSWGFSSRCRVVMNAVLDVRNSDQVCKGAQRPRSDNICALFVGRLDYQKGFDILLSAFDELKRRGISIDLDVVGDVVLGNPIDFDELRARGLRMHGWLSSSDIDEFYASADVLIVPSRYEGFGLVAIEALRNGTPIIVSENGALPEIVGESGCGIVYGSDARDLASCIANLNLESLLSMRLQARRRYEELYSAGRFARDYELVFAELQR